MPQETGFSQSSLFHAVGYLHLGKKEKPEKRAALLYQQPVFSIT